MHLSSLICWHIFILLIMSIWQQTGFMIGQTPNTTYSADRGPAATGSDLFWQLSVTYTTRRCKDTTPGPDDVIDWHWQLALPCTPV